MYRTHTIENEVTTPKGDNANTPKGDSAVLDTLHNLTVKNEQNMALLEQNRKLLREKEEHEKKYQIIVSSIERKRAQLIKDKKKFNYNTIIEWLHELPQPDESPAGLAMQNFQMKYIDRDPKKASVLENRCYDIALPPVIPGNQWFSGRCWMFAGLNILRPYFIMKYNLGPDFELSQAYLFFWHYLEQYENALNLFYYEEMSEEEKSMRLSHLLSDGGNWIIFRRLIEKYGIVPKKIYGESWQSKNSQEMNKRMCEMLAKDLQQCHILKQNDDTNGYNEFLVQSLKKAERVLTLCMGTPPDGRIVIQCKPKIIPNTQQQLQPNLPSLVPLEDGIYNSPLEMFADVEQKYRVCKHVQLINDPRKEFSVWYKTQHQHLKAVPELFLNMKMDDISNIITKSIQNNIGVWFACNVNEDFSKKLQGMTNDLFRPDIFLNVDLKMSKKDRMIWGRARCNHAMLITGVQFERGEPNSTKTKKIAAFQVQNSWGETGPGRGFYKMTKDWFDEHCYTAVVHSELSNELPDIPSDDNIEEYTWYDFFG